MLFFGQAVNLYQNRSLHLSFWIPYHIKLSRLRDPQGYCFHTSWSSTGAGQFKANTMPTPRRTCGWPGTHAQLFWPCSLLLTVEITWSSTLRNLLVVRAISGPLTLTSTQGQRQWSIISGATILTPLLLSLPLVSGLRLITAHASAASNHSKITQEGLTCECEIWIWPSLSEPTILLLPKSMEGFLQTKVGSENFSKSRLRKDHITSIGLYTSDILILEKTSWTCCYFTKGFFLTIYGMFVLLSPAGHGVQRLGFVSLPRLEIQELQDIKFISSITKYSCVSKGYSFFFLYWKKPANLYRTLKLT